MDDQFHLTEEDHALAKSLGPRSQKGEVIVLYENGISPVKRPNPHFREIPLFFPRYNPVRQATVEINGERKGTTEELEDIEATAIQNLHEKYAGMIAKKVAGLVAKRAVGYGVEKATGSPLLGLAAEIALMASDSADLRSWNLLPRDLQVLRVPVDPGTYTVQVFPNGSGALPPKTIQVAPGKKVFVDFRYMPAF